MQESLGQKKTFAFYDYCVFLSKGVKRGQGFSYLSFKTEF